MSDGPEWFSSKRYGLGPGLPISWQGWALTITFVAVCIADGSLFAKDRPLVFIAVLVPFAAMFIVISMRTTRGGVRWRWGEED